MRELGRRDDVADRVDAVDTGANVAVDGDEPALVDFHGGAFEPDVPPNAAAGRRSRRPYRPAGSPRRPWLGSGSGRRPVVAGAGDRTPVCALIAALLERADDRLRDLLVDAGRIWGKASRIVTSAPTSTRNDANSHPIAPPPITATRAGTRSAAVRRRTTTPCRRRTRSPSNGELRAATNPSRSARCGRDHGSVGDADRAGVGRRVLPSRRRPSPCDL